MRYLFGLSLVGLLAGATADVQAGEGCDQCGCQDVCRVCKVVCDTKKVTKVVWGCKCEDVCLPGYIKDCGHKCRLSGHCHGGCDDSCGEGACCDACPEPSHCQVRGRKKLIRYEIEEEVPVYKWVVEYSCGCQPGCCDGGTHPVAPAPGAGDQTTPPAPPPIDAAQPLGTPSRLGLFDRLLGR